MEVHAVFFWSALLIPPQIIILLFSRGKAAFILPTFWQHRICNAFGLKVEVIGTPVLDRQALFVSNHISYLDIPVIAGVLPASFVAKADVASWPVFGLLAKLQQTAFVSRSRATLAQEKAALSNVLAQGRSLIIFPEGTSSDGQTVLPFKTSLFGLALESGQDITVQPFTIELASVDGHEVSTQADRDLYAWHGDMTLMPHFWAFAKSSGAKVRLHFHPPLRVQQISDRKELARICYDLVAAPLNHRASSAA
ncbi:MAG: 1-acyl-sn-glycerol-3-phosphate acyltransferase [Rhodospirillales bacterium]|nr:1-acyl-sn-glycerol-3-phosphate acyltransferase [Rhodospirillales bacterium]